jgi:hypothetical protein
MDRYRDVEIKKDSKGRRYYKALKYPTVDFNDNDIYTISIVNDRLDLLALNYYRDMSYYWIIAVANNLKCDSLYLTPGTQIRIPYDIEKIKEDFNILNNLQ